MKKDAEKLRSLLKQQEGDDGVTSDPAWGHWKKKDKKHAPEHHTFLPGHYERPTRPEATNFMRALTEAAEDADGRPVSHKNLEEEGVPMFPIHPLDKKLHDLADWREDRARERAR